MPWLFSYGTLQQEHVQLSTFGRLLHGQRDEILGFEQSLVRIEDPQVVAASGETHYANVTFNGRNDSRVRGTVFEITEADMQSKSLYACLRALGVNLKIAHQRISARLMTDEEDNLLDEETQAACLTVDRLAYDDVGQFVEFCRHVYHAAHYSIQSSVVA